MTISGPTTTPATLVAVTGPDGPGVVEDVLRALAAPDVAMLDVEQVTLGGRLSLFVVVTPPPGAALPTAELSAVAERHGLSLALTAGDGDGDRAAPGRRLHVTMIGPVVPAAAVAEVAARVRAAGAGLERLHGLGSTPVTAIEAVVVADDAGTLRRELADVAAAHALDIAVGPAGLARRARRLVVMDVDSTVIQDEVIELLAAHAGRQAEVAAVTERAMRGELDFAASLHERVACLAGLPVSVLDEVRAAVRLTPGARTLCRTLVRLGHPMALVSGGFVEVVRPLADDLGIRHVAANRLEVGDGLLTGRVTGPVVDRAGKAAALRRFAAAEGVPLEHTVAVGDGANDLDMIAAAGLGVAFNAKPVVRAQADAAVSVPHLDVVLHLMGIPRAEVDEPDDPTRAGAGAGG